MKTKRKDIIRFGSFGPIVETADGWRFATQEDMDTLEVGEDLTPEEEDEIPDDN
jgi:hypothetical protein